MKKVFLAVLAIAAMMVSCQKEGLVDNQKETPEVEVNELQPVILGSNLFKAPTTKASVDNMDSWQGDMKDADGNIDKFIYVWALNHNVLEGEYPSKDIENVSATLATGTTSNLTGSLVLKDPGENGVVDENDPPFYYGVDDKDIYDFYAYYLGYSIDGTDTDDKYENGLITVSDVKVTGDNDIMIAETDKAADAIVGGTMVNPKYLYSQYSARHGVKPNLVFNHMLSKFTFYVRYAGNLPNDNEIKLTGITFKNAVKLGNLTLNGDNRGFVAATGEGVLGDIAVPGLSEDASLELSRATESEEDDFGYTFAGNAMVVPAGEGSYTIDINFQQKFGNEELARVESFKYENKVITPNDVVITDGRANSFEKGKQYRVYITVYGLEEVVVNVQLVPWEHVGDITFDPDQKEDGVYQYVVATKEGEDTSIHLFAKAFIQGELVYTDFEGSKAAEGTYTLDDASKERTGIATIKVKSDGTIEEITQYEAPQQEPVE